MRFWKSIFAPNSLYKEIYYFDLQSDFRKNFPCEKIAGNPFDLQKFRLLKTLYPIKGFAIFKGRDFTINPIQDGSFRCCSRMERGGGLKDQPLPKISQTNAIMMKLGTAIPYLKKIQNIYKSRYRRLEFYWHQYFFTKNKQFFLYQEIQIKFFWVLLSSLVLKVFILINRTAILEVSAKLATASLSPTNFSHVNQIILQMWLRDQSLAILAILYKKLSQLQSYKDLTRKNKFFVGWSFSSLIIWGWW